VQEQRHSQYIQDYLIKLSKLRHQCSLLTYGCKYVKKIELPNWISTRVFWYYKYGMYLPINGFPLYKGIDFTCNYLLDSVKRTVQKHSLIIKLNEQMFFIKDEDTWCRKVKPRKILFKLFAWKAPWDISCNLRGIEPINAEDLVLTAIEIYSYLWINPLSTHGLIGYLRPILRSQLKETLDAISKEYGE